MQKWSFTLLLQAGVEGPGTLVVISPRRGIAKVKLPNSEIKLLLFLYYAKRDDSALGGVPATEAGRRGRKVIARRLFLEVESISKYAMKLVLRVRRECQRVLIDEWQDMSDIVSRAYAYRLDVDLEVVDFDGETGD